MTELGSNRVTLAKVWFPLSSTWTISIFLEFYKCHSDMYT